MYDTDQEQFRLYAKHIGDPTITEVERRKNTQFYDKLQLHGTTSLRFPFHSPEDFVTQAGSALETSKTPTSTTYLDNPQVRRAWEIYTKAFEALKDEPDNGPLL